MPTFAQAIAARWFRHELIRLYCVFGLLLAVLLFAIIFATEDGGQTAFGPNFSGDYAQFYVAGEILNQGRTSQLYDLDYQDLRLHQILPKVPSDQHLTYVYPPFLALLFRPLALLPFKVSYVVWMVISALFYVGACRLALGTCSTFNAQDRMTAWFLVLSTSIFWVECELGGQISAIGTLALASGYYWSRRGFPLASGLCFSLLAYKPSLLFLLLPMFALSRSWRILLGLALGGLVLGLVSCLMVGWEGCVDFVKLMATYGSTGSTRQGFKTLKYLDLTAFLTLLGVSRTWARGLAILVGLPILGALVVCWWRAGTKRLTETTFAATVVLTLLLNVYGPIYDAAILVPAILVGADAIRRRNEGVWPMGLSWALALVVVSCLVTQPSAVNLGFQPLTLALLVLGLLFLSDDLRGRRGKIA